MPTSPERTHYQVLGVAPGATTQQIRDAHRQLARMLHPDRLAGASDAERRLAERRMREVNAAWTTLSNPDRRTDYDRRLRAGATGPTGGAGASGATGYGPASSRGAGATVDDTARNPGSGWPVDDDPDEFYSRLRAARVDLNEPELPSWQFWLLRRGPIVAALAVAAFLFVVTAYAGGGGGGSGDEAVSTTNAARDCVRLTEGRTATRVSCEVDNDGRIVTVVGAALDCPAGTSYVILDADVTCVTDDPSIVADTTTTLRD
ncbi:MAG: J domain-containing protein [Microthrixaceae bacterium]